MKKTEERSMKKQTAWLVTAALGALLLTAACRGPAAATATPGTAPAAEASPPAAAASPVASGATSPAPQPATGPDTREVRVRFTAGDAEIIVRISDNPTSRDFLSMLPLTLNFKEFSGMEKIAYLPRRLTTQGSAGRAPANGDLIYFVPWGNLGFFYNAARRDPSFDDRVIPIGTVVSGFERPHALETGPVRVERVP